MPDTPWTSAWPPSSPSVPTSRATRVTSSANDESWSTIVLIVFFSSRISPLTSTVIFWVRSPCATAVVTCAMLRTCAVRFDAMKLTDSVRSFHVPDTPCDLRLPTELALGTDLARDAGHLVGERRQLIDHRVDRRADPQELALDRLAADLERHLLRQVALGDRHDHARDLGRRAHEIVDQRVQRVDRRRPGAARAVQLRALGHPALAADDLADADQLAGDIWSLRSNRPLNAYATSAARRALGLQAL